MLSNLLFNLLMLAHQIIHCNNNMSYKSNIISTSSKPLHYRKDISFLTYEARTRWKSPRTGVDTVFDTPEYILDTSGYVKKIRYGQNTHGYRILVAESL